MLIQHLQLNAGVQIDIINIAVATVDFVDTKICGFKKINHSFVSSSFGRLQS